jgi:multiple sugar transport system substrate-binding protein
MNRRKLLINGTLSICAPYAQFTQAQNQNRFSRFRGQTLTMSIPLHPQYDAMVKLLPTFTEQTGIKVEVDRQTVPKMKELQLSELAKPQGSYDLASYVVMWKSEYVKKNLIHDLAPFLKNPALADPSFDIDDIVPAYLENIGLVGGWLGYLAGPTAKLYGLPYGAETSILAYRSDIFERLKLNVPITYYEFEQLLPILRDKSGLGALSSRAKAGHQCVHAWLLHLNPMGGKVFDNNWRLRFNDNVGVRALKLLQLVVDTGPENAINFDQGEMTRAFLQGETCMYLDSTNIIGSIRDTKKSKINGKVTFARHPKATKYSSQSGGLGLAIAKNSKSPDAAFLLLQWLTTKEQDKAVCALGGGPSRISTLLDPDLTKQYPEYKILRSQLRDVDPDWRPIIPEWDEINVKMLGLAISDALKKAKTAEKALSDITPLVTDIMRKNGYIKT